MVDPTEIDIVSYSGCQPLTGPPQLEPTAEELPAIMTWLQEAQEKSNDAR